MLDPLDPGATVIVACSGGADSLALLSAAIFEGHKRSLRVVGVTVDHGLQEGSADTRGASRRADGRDGCRRDDDRDRDRRRRRGRARRRPPGRRGTPSWRRSPSGSPPPVCCSATPSTTRPRPCCSAWPAARAGGRWPACGAGSTASRARSSTYGATTPSAACQVEGLDGVGGPAQLGPVLHPGARPPHDPAAARGRARSRRGQDPRPDRRPAPRRHGAARRAGRRGAGAGGDPATASRSRSWPSSPRRCAAG